MFLSEMYQRLSTGDPRDLTLVLETLRPWALELDVLCECGHMRGDHVPSVGSVPDGWCYGGEDEDVGNCKCEEFTAA